MSVYAAYPNCPGDTTNGIWQITGTQTVNTTETIVCDYINISSTGKLYVNSSIGNFSVNFTLNNLYIASGGEINSTGLGWKNGSGQGRGADSTSTAGEGGGGAYGGVGGISEQGYRGGNPYGDPFAPSLLGSPGGAGRKDQPTAIGKNGGGAIYINVSGTLWNNGTISANGIDAVEISGGGAGSGGSIWIDTVNYYGTGSLVAKGGISYNFNSDINDPGTGSGGRIAVYYNTTNSEMQFNRSSVASLPGTAGGTIAAPGTAIFIDKDDNNWYILGGFDFNLATYNVTNVTIEHAFLRVNRSFELNATNFVNTGNRVTNMSCYNTSHNFTFNILDNVGLSNFNVSDKGIWYNECGNITILRTQIRTNFTTNNTYLQSNDTIKFNVTDDSLTFNVVSMVGNNYFTNIKTVILNDTNLYGNINFTDIINFSIYNTSTLNATGTGYRNGSGEGRGANGGANVAGGGGAYGGVGGISEQNIKGGNPYGDPLSPFLLGSPGGYGHNGANTGQSGGGAIYINVSGTLWNNGTISANGIDAVETRGGGAGSGGSIWIDTVNYYGTGSLVAKGGISYNFNSDIYDPGTGSGGRIAVYYNTTNSEMQFNRSSVASLPGTAGGTIAAPGTAIFIDKDENNWYILGGFDFNLATYNVTNVTIEHAFLRVNRSFELNATSFVNTENRITNLSCYNTSHDFTFRILDNLGLNNFNVSDKGADYNECGNITILLTRTRTNYTINFATIQSNNTLNFNVTDDDLNLVKTIFYGNMNFTVKNMSINGTSALIANFRGFGNGSGTGTGVSKAGAGGAGYGGAGGAGVTAGATGGSTYGTAANSNLLGSGGAGSTTAAAVGGNGGGLIVINASNILVINGTINASGQAGTTSGSNAGGGGSGGSILIWARIFNGTPILMAHGGNGGDTSNDGGGGGGGRIAVYYASNTTSNIVTDARGGEGNSATDGSAGTVMYGLLQINLVTTPAFNVSLISKSTGVKASTIYSSPIGNSGTVYFRWYRNGTEIFTDNQSSILVDTTVNSVLSSDLYNSGDLLNVTVYANDGIDNSPVKESETKTVVGDEPVLSAVLMNSSAYYNANIYLTVNVSDPQGDTIAVNFTVIAPDGSIVLNNVNGTYAGVQWNSTSFTLNKNGTYNYSVVSYDAAGFSSNVTGQINFILVSLSLTPQITNTSNTYTVSGHVNFTNGSNVINNLVSTYVNGTLMSRDDSSWWNNSWGYRKPINLSETYNITRRVDAVVITINASISHLANCTKELRIVNNATVEIPWELISETEDVSTRYCRIRFPVNMTGNTTVNYYAYYDNSLASAPTYGIINYTRVSNSSNIASSTAGGTATTCYSHYSVSSINDGNTGTSDDSWNGCGTNPEWWAINWTTAKIINRVEFYEEAFGDGWIINNPIYFVDYWNGTNYVNVSGILRSPATTLSNGNDAWYNATFDPVTTTSIRLRPYQGGSATFTGLFEIYYFNATNLSTSLGNEEQGGILTNATGDYNTTLTAPSSLGVYTVLVNTSYGSFYGEATNTLTVLGLPTVDVPVFNVTTVTKTSGIKANTTYNDALARAGSVYFTWYRNWSNIFTENFTSIPANTIVNSTLSSTLYNRGDVLNVTVYANNGEQNSLLQKSSALTVTNSLPSQSTPILNSTLGTNTTSYNLTVYNISTADVDGDSVKNIINWYRNNTPIMVLNMPFEGKINTTNASDYSGYQNNGTVTGATWNATGGYDGKGAFMFDGNDYINISSPSRFSWSQVSISFYTKPSDLVTNQYLFGGRNNTIDNIMCVILGYQDNYFNIYHKDAYPTGTATDTQISATQNVWQHIVYSSDGSRIYGYKNGALLVNVSANLNVSLITQYLIGSNAGGGDNYNGVIDEIRIYNISLTPAQVLALYNNRSDILDSSMLASNDFWNASITPNDGTHDGTTLFSTALSIRSTPTVDVPVFNVTTVTKTTGIKANTTYKQQQGSPASVYFTWYRNWSNIFTENFTNIPANTIVNSTLSSTLYNKGDLLNVTVYADDNSGNSTIQKSATIIVQNAAPLQSTPILNSTLGTNTTSYNLTVYNISTTDVEGDSVKNIINWYRNNTPIMVLNMPFEGKINTSNASDYSGYQHNGTVTGATWMPTGGYDGKGAFDFNSNVITVPYSARLSLPHEFTIALWEKAETINLGDVNSLIGMWHHYYLRLGWGNVGLSIVNDANGESSCYTPVSFSTGTWYHLTGVVKWLGSGTNYNLTIYIDGVYNKSCAANFARGTDTNYNLIIGKSSWGGTEYFDGIIDDIKIYNTSLTPAQVLALYNNRTDILDSSMLAVGDTWNASITPNDKINDGTTLFTTNLTLKSNNAPTVDVPVFNVTTVTRSSGIKANTTYNDIDTTAGTLYFRWYRNDTEIYTDNQSSIAIGTIVNTTLNTGLYNVGDLLNVTVYANDGMDNSTLQKSVQKTVVNAVPSLTVPAFNVSNITPSSGVKASTTYTDTDGDAGTLYFRWFRNGSEVFTNNQSGIASGSSAASTLNSALLSAGDFINVTVYANDGADNSATQQSTTETVWSDTSPTSIDIANTTAITVTPSAIRQGDVVSFNATFNVTGNINATGLNITLTVDNSYVAAATVTIVNGTTQQVELNWTAIPGIHTIKLNADANNTFIELFENNNNATATITAYNISVLNLSSPITNTQIIRGKDTAALPGEDTLKKVSNLTTILARVYNKNVQSVGVNSNCTYYLNTTYLGFNTTNTTGECSLTFDHTLYNTSMYTITVNFTNLNTTDYLADTSTALIQNSTIIDLSKVEIDLDADNMRTGSVYNPGDVAVMNITVTKNSTAYDPDKFIVEIKNPGTECNNAGGVLYNHSYPGDIVKISTGLYQSYSILIDDTDIHWCVVVNNSAASPLASASHSDKEVTDTGANRANFTVINTASTGDDEVFDDVNISFKTAGNYQIFDTNFSATSAENRLITLHDKYNVLFKHPQRQEQLSITGLNITSGNKSMPFNFLTSYSGSKPVNFTNTTDIIAFNNSGFVFTSATITLQKSGLTFDKILHCLNWNFTGGYCIGSWEINTTADYSGFNQNATHFWFAVNSFSAYAGGNGTNSQLQIYDSAEGSYTEAGTAINFTANYTRIADNTSITSANCTFNTSATLYDMTYNAAKQTYNYTTTLSSGNKSWTVSCSKGSSFDNLNATDTIEIRDTTAPVVSGITPIEVSNDQNNTYSATVTDAGGIANCYFVVDSVNKGLMDYNGTTATISAVLSTASSRTFTVYANCTDNAGNNAYNASGVSIYLPTGDGQKGSSKAASSATASTANDFEGGTKYTNLQPGNAVPIGKTNKQAKVVSVYPNSVRLDVGGLYNIVLLEGLFKRLDLNQNGIPETTVYVDKVVAYSKADITVLVEDDGGSVSQQAAEQSFSLLGEIWNKVKETAQETQEKQQQQEPVEEQPAVGPQEQVEQITKTIVQRIREQIQASWNKLTSLFSIFSSGKVTGAVVYEETAQFIDTSVLSSTQMKIAAIVTITALVIFPLITGSYIFRRACKKKADTLGRLLKDEMKYRGLR